jgi:ParB-like chromosome segregation protein Spo0J
MSKKAQPDFAGISDGVPQAFKSNGWIGKEIVYLKPSDLRANPLNSTLFRRENEEYFTKLSEDIQTRGILVPLIAKRDNTLLAGHNRLEIAQRLKLKVVPVQYVDTALTEATEKEFVIKDNLLRRQLSTGERIELYRLLYPNFDERIVQEHRGGDRKSSHGKAEHIQEKSKLTARQIAEDTGQRVTAVKQQVHKHRKELLEATTGEKKIKSISHTFDSSGDVKASKEKASRAKKNVRTDCVRLLKDCAKRVSEADVETVTQVYKKAAAMMKLLETI